MTSDEIAYAAGQKLRNFWRESEERGRRILAELFPEEELTPRRRAHRDEMAEIMRKNREAWEPAVRALVKMLEQPFD